MSQINTSFNKISTVIDRYIPSFIKDQYPLFYDFLVTYYEWCERNEMDAPWNVIKNIQNWNDIDYTIEFFINYFNEEYFTMPNQEDQALYIKHFAEILASKGSTKSLLFFLKILTGLDVSITYPNRYLMKSSDGEWVRYGVIYCELDGGVDYGMFLSTRLKGLYSNATAYIERMEIYGDYLKVYVSHISGEFSLLDILEFNNGEQILNSNVINTVSSIGVVSKGNNYQEGERVNITGHSSFVGYISKVGLGKLDNITIMNGGTNYQVGDKILFGVDRTSEFFNYPEVYVSETDITTGEIKRVDIRYPGFGFLTIPQITGIQTLSGEGAQFTISSNDAGSIQEITIVQPSNRYTAPISVTIDTEEGVNGSLEAILGPKSFEPYKYIKRGSVLDAEFKLQDSYYWQEYSYVLSVSGSVLGKYSDIFRNILHPAGFIYFTATDLTNYIDVSSINYIDSNISIRMGYDRNINSYFETLQYMHRQYNQTILDYIRNTRLSTIATRRLDSFVGGDGGVIWNGIEIS